MEKLDLTTPDLTEDNVARIAELFPNVVTEAKGADGKVKRAIDFDALRQEPPGHIVEGPQERYHLNWPGKRQATLAANAPINKTLRPVRQESVNFDTTRNLFIEGDNLDALKLLQETYLGKVKMIYIDPPYNTGKDFIYRDNFTVAKDVYEEQSGQRNEEGGRLLANLDSNGRFHSDWLTMIYPRLKLARNLLADDGVIFISIGDAEIANLTRLCHEQFGEDNFVANFVWEKRTNRENRKVVSSRHDNVLCYRKAGGTTEKPLRQLPLSEQALAAYRNPDRDPRGLWKSDPATAQAGHGTKSQFYTLIAPNGQKHELESGRCWVFTEPEMQKEIAAGKIWFGRNGTGVPRIKTYLEEKERGLVPETIIFAEQASTNETAKNYLKDLFGGIAVFDTPKPVELLRTFLQITRSSELVMDFFAGSNVLSEAVFRQNVADGLQRAVITIQLNEPTDADSEAHTAGYFDIASISKERIRRAGAKILAENPDHVGKLDIGFRVLRVDSGNMTDVFHPPEQVRQEDLLKQLSNIKPDRNAEDLLFQVLLDWGVDITLPIAHETIEAKAVYFVDGKVLAACFDKGVNETLVRQMAARKPLRVVFRDDGFDSDATKINVEQWFKHLSPSTEVKVI